MLPPHRPSYNLYRPLAHSLKSKPSQKHVKTKNTKEVIEFYYIWKKTAHYKVWKKQYIPPDEDVDSDDDY